jgi:5,10-methylene-tetrahydrofolate dehydrogenase/methenyl tetrahydrofolate cyclohydrolase
VGHLLSSTKYVNLKKKACDKVGIRYEGETFEEDVSQEEVEYFVN